MITYTTKEISSIPMMMAGSPMTSGLSIPCAFHQGNMHSSLR